jgi:hypothetical protein
MEDRANDNEDLGEAIASLQNKHAEVVLRNARNTRALIVAGIVWSFVYTAISLFIMFGMSTQTHETCEQFSASREAVRALILSDPDFDTMTVYELSEVLPPIEC